MGFWPMSPREWVQFVFLMASAVAFYWVFAAPFWHKDSDDDDD